MKAMVIKDFGGPEVIEQRDIDKPEPGANELLVKVKATSVNPVDYKIRRKRRVLSGIQPSGSLHTGNHLGAIKQ